jgi:uncharacterized membrane protein
VDATVSEWLNLLLRWFHVFVGILWIGQTWLFTFFEAHFTAPEPARANVAGELWMVHSGGFYRVEKQKVPQLLPTTLHWFRWEAALTWLSGMALLLLVYYAGGLLTDDRVADINVTTAAGIGLSLLVLAWLVYDATCRSSLGQSALTLAASGFALILAVAFALGRFLGARAVYMHVGAMLGTLMAANVWLRILPAQRQMLTALKEGKSPDLGLGEQAKLRSKHNTFLVVPLVFIMLSSHFPTVSYGHPHSELMLGLFILLGWAAASLARTR